MRINYYSIFSIMLLAGCLNLYGGTIKGSVTDSKTGSPIIGATLLVMGAKIEASTDINGLYSIKDLAPGKYIIRASYIYYRYQSDSITIKDQDEVIELNIKLKSPTLDLNSVSTPQLEEYHEKLEVLNKIKPVMEINIDSW